MKHTSLIVLFSILVTCTISAQVINEPLAYVAKIKCNKNAKIYYKIICDINHSGIDDVLLAVKPTPKEIAVNKWMLDGENKVGIPFQPNLCGFYAFIGRREGGYTFQIGVDSMTIDLDKCFIGFIGELKQYGIVSLEYDNEDNGSRFGAACQTIYCYTIEGGHIKRTDLTGHDYLYYLKEKQSPIFQKYLTDARRTHVTPQEVTP